MEIRLVPKRNHPDLVAWIAIILGVMLSIYLKVLVNSYGYQHLVETKNYVEINCIVSFGGVAVALFFGGLYRWLKDGYAIILFVSGMVWFIFFMATSLGITNLFLSNS